MTCSTHKTSIIIIQAENRGYLPEAIASAKAQTVPVEIVVVSKKQSLGKNFNEGVARSTGKYTKILADDDLLPPDAIESLEQAIGEKDFIHANAINFWPDGKTRYHKKGPVKSFEQLMKKNTIHGGTVLYRKDAIVEVGGMDAKLWTGEEFDLHLKLLKKGYKLEYLNQVVYQYRQHKGQKSRDMIERRAAAIKEIKRRYR